MGFVQKLDDLAFGIDLAARVAIEWIETGIVYNPMRRAMREDPYPFYRRLREQDPVHRSRPASGWVLTRYDDILAVLGDRSFSSDERHWRRYRRVRGLNGRAGLPDPYALGVVSMLRVDAPDHTRLRTLVSRAFTPRAVERMRPRIEAVVDGLLDDLAGRSEFELVRDFSSPLPVTIIGEMLGVSVADRDRFRAWSNDAIGFLGDGPREQRIRAAAALGEMQAWLEGEIALRRREPREDLLSGLVAAEEAGDRLSSKELFGICVLLLLAGNETTTNLIGNGMLALLRHPEQYELLRKEPARIPDAVEEMLRFDSPVQLTSRIVMEESSLRGRSFEPGDQVVLVLAAGNRDPERFRDPDRFDVTREGVRPLSFGYGVHHCLGAQLARLEATVAFGRLLERYPVLRPGAGRVAFGHNTVLRGPACLPLRVGGAGA